MPLSPGQVVNSRYRIVKLLGQGGMGAVYHAWDTVLNHAWALKENLDTSHKARRQFEREALMLAKLSHPSLPRVINHFIIPNQGQYLVMDFIEGENLQVMLEKTGKPLFESRVLDWISQVCDALEYLHSQKPPIIHRDIKPANIRITPQGKAILVDFGIAKAYDPNVTTTTGARAVTPGYSPQEQYGVGITDIRTDIYALGATMYHLLTGKQPIESVLRTMGFPLDIPGKHNPLVSVKTQNAIMKAMEPLPEKRFQSIAEFRQAFTTIRSQQQAVQVQPTKVQSTTLSSRALPASEKPEPPARRFPWKWVGPMAILGAAGVIFTIIVVIIFIFNRFSKSTVDDLSATQTFVELSLTQPAVTLEAPSQSPVTTLVSIQTPTMAQTPLPSLTGVSGPAQKFTDEKGVNMLLVSGGDFLMGGSADTALAECQKLYSGVECRRDMFLDEEPVHPVFLNDFYIDRTEVTNASYGQCVEDRVCSLPENTTSDTRRSYFGIVDFADYPVIYVSWEQAKVYCAWRGADLPTEAQWEKAARGIDGRLFPWGDVFDGTRVNFCDRNCSKDWANQNWDDGYADTSPVGNYPSGASVYGVLDLAGNVWEWVQDWYSETYYNSQTSWHNPFGPEIGEARVVRGGAWRADGSDLLGANRSKYIPTIRNNILGFRCARAP